jgi:hypothetical protein
VIDLLARPRVGIVVPGGDDAWVVAVAARVATLAVLDRLPRARVSVLQSGGVGLLRGALDCGRPARPLAPQDRQRFDVLVVCGGATMSGRASGGGCPVVRLPGGLLDVAILAGSAGGDDLRRNRVGTLRLLGWLPADSATPHVVVDASGAEGGVQPPAVAVVAGLTAARPEDDAAVPPGEATSSGPGVPRVTPGLLLPADAGVDEVVAAVACASRYAGLHPVLAAIAAGAGVPCDAAAAPRAGAAEIAAALDQAAAAAVECWRGRGSPGAQLDHAPTRRAATQNAALRVEIRGLERDLEAAEAHAAGTQAAADLITGSRTWRYTERVRGAYHTARGRLRR